MSSSLPAFCQVFCFLVLLCLHLKSLILHLHCNFFRTLSLVSVSLSPRYYLFWLQKELPLVYTCEHKVRHFPNTCIFQYIHSHPSSGSSLWITSWILLWLLLSSSFSLFKLTLHKVSHHNMVILSIPQTHNSDIFNLDFSIGPLITALHNNYTALMFNAWDEVFPHHPYRLKSSPSSYHLGFFKFCQMPSCWMVK